jgi:hypothetical protein
MTHKKKKEERSEIMEETSYDREERKGLFLLILLQHEYIVEKT